MRSNKGISMITLVITIICMLIFLGIAYRIGSRYISKSKEEEKNALISIISDAAERRQNDKHVGLGENQIYYSGYHMTSGDFDKVSTMFEKNDKPYEPGLWHIVDAKGAKELGVVSAEEYLIDDLLDDEKDDEDEYVAVVDYYSGKVELVKYLDVKVDVDDVIKGEDNSGHTHTTTIATCTEPSVCVGCGSIVTPALGHDFNYTKATCTKDMKCERCGYIQEKATGHKYGTEINYNDKGHFNICINEYQGVICGAIGNFEEHDRVIGMTPGEDYWKHYVSCEKCAYAGEEDCDKAIKAKDKVHHTIYCTICLKEKYVEHDVIKYRYIDKNKHVVYCDTCKTDLREEEHIDEETPFGVCDKCDGVIDMEKVPEIISLTMENATAVGLNKYWAKKDDTIVITIKTNMMLSIAPNIQIQGILIKDEDITNPDKTTWIATIDANEYNFKEGELGIYVSRVRSIWGVVGDNLSATTDGKYIMYDSILPEYSIIPE